MKQSTKFITSVASSIESELPHDNTQNETRFVERLYNGIKHHATSGEDGTSMVILKTTPNAPGYTELQFGEPKQAMEGIDLYLKYDAPGFQRKLQRLKCGVKEILVVTQCSYAYAVTLNLRARDMYAIL